jgi:hypothetical protein
MEHKTEKLGEIPFEINRKELYIYAGYDAKTTPSDEVLALIDECIAEVKAVAQLRAILKWCPITHEKDEAGEELLGEFSIGDFAIKSEALGKNLSGCKDAILVGATLSPSVDLLLHRYAKLQVAKSLLMQATAAAYIEAYLDEIQRVIKKRIEPEGLTLRPRFSPGFADFGTEYQPAFLRAINAEKQLGITLAKDSNMMVPSKSVTAVMGICKL